VKVVHRVTLSIEPPLLTELLADGISAREGLNTLRLTEAVWNSWGPRLEAAGAVHLIETSFTSAELSRAPWLRVVAAWHHGYPQPHEDSFGYLSTTYSAESGCGQCGAGRVQVEPFRMAKEPVWGSRQLLQLHWVFDEFFATPQLWSTAFAPLGIGKRPVSDRGGTGSLRTVVQLDVEESGSLRIDEVGSSCPTCSVRKYLPSRAGYFPGLADPPTGHMVRSVEWFGSGASAANAVLVSQELYSRLKKLRVKGVKFVPALSEQSS
jgi:hypothetical protein